MADYIESSQLPEGEKIYMKHDWLGWRVVHPIKNEDGSWNWFNLIFGSKSNMILILLCILLALGLYVGIKELIAGYGDIVKEPCKYCVECARIRI